MITDLRALRRVQENEIAITRLLMPLRGHVFRSHGMVHLS